MFVHDQMRKTQRDSLFPAAIACKDGDRQSQRIDMLRERPDVLLKQLRFYGQPLEGYLALCSPLFDPNRERARKVRKGLPWYIPIVLSSDDRSKCLASFEVGDGWMHETLVVLQPITIEFVELHGPSLPHFSVIAGLFPRPNVLHEFHDDTLYVVPVCSDGQASCEPLQG